MKINNLTKLFFFIVLTLVVLTLATGFIYKKYSEEGNILGFKIVKTGNLNPTSSQILPTPIPTLLPATPIKIEEKLTATNVPTVTLTPIPGYGIKIINYPDRVKLNDNTTFTWYISGPASSTGFTVIVGAKESQQGNLDENTDLTKTPYRILVKDFTTGTYNIPLTFVGNTVLPEYGSWYIRALAQINNKNLWSDEYTVTVY